MGEKATVLSLLGGFLLSVGGERRDIPARKVKALLARLALESGPLARDHLAALLWPDSAPAAARHSLRQALSDLRRVLEGSACGLRVTTTEVAFEPGAARVDVLEFQTAAASDDPPQWARGMALYRGALLEGLELRVDTFDTWLEEARQALLQSAVRLCRLLAEHHEDDVDGAIAWSKRLLSLDPLDEAAHRDLMRLYIVAGQDGAALRQFLHCRSMLERELGIQPDAETTALYQSLLSHRRHVSPQAERSADSPADGEPAAAAPAAAASPRLRPAVVLACEVAVDEPDPELADAAWQQALAQVSRVARSFGGRMVAHLGRQIVCAFGLERVRGTEADRACLAGTELVAAIPGLRAGLASGQVLYRPEEGSLVGQAASEAQSLCARARPGELSMDEAVAAARRWRPGTESDAAPLVGRAMEVRQFVAVLDACRDGGHGCALLIRGEPGIGKSRLVREYVSLAEKEEFRVHLAQAYDFGTARGQDVLAQLVRAVAGEGTGNRELASRVGEAHVPYLRALLGEDADPGSAERLGSLSPYERMERSAEALAALVRVAARDGAQVLVVDDLHWADRLTLAVLPRLARAVAELPVVLLMTSRVAGEALDPEWRAAMGEAPLLTLDLRPLRLADAGRLASALGAGKEHLGALLDRASGNPLFLEQLVRFGHRTDGLPHSIQSLAVAQLEALPASVQESARAASVLGQHFALEVLEAVAAGPPDLEAAADAGLVVRGDGEWSFHHALIRDGVYQSMLASERRALHDRAAAFFQGRSLSLHAQHLDLADAPGAVPALLDAAADEIDHYRLSLARALVRRALARAPEEARAMLIDAQLELMLGNTAEAVRGFQAARGAADSAAVEARALVGLGMALNQMDDAPGAVEALERAVALNVDDHAYQADAWLQLGNALFPQGLTEACLEAHQTSLRHAERARSTLRQARAEGGLGDAYYQQGAMRTAFEHYDRCVALGEANGHPSVVPPNLAMRGLTRLFLNRLDDALADGRRSLELAEASSNLRHQLLAHNVLAGVESFHGDYEQGLEHARHTLELGQRIGSRRFAVDGYAQMAHLLWAQGRLEEARRVLRSALEVLDDSMLPFSGAYLRGLLAACAESDSERHEHLRVGEALLGHRAVSHCHLYFYVAAMEGCLSHGEHQAALHYADCLTAYTAQEPLPFCDFFVRRARLLVAGAQAREDERAALIAAAQEAGLRAGLRFLTELA